MQKSKSNKLNIIINGDCIEEMKKLDAESVDMIFADPPYFMQTEGTLFRASGEKFYDKNEISICKLDKDGYVFDDEETMSIHKMSAKHLHKANNNGWDYFYIKRGGKLISINELRYKYDKEMKSKI